MTAQTFNAIGITTLNDETKVRFSNDTIRHITRFNKAGAERIEFVDLPHEMTKIEALEHMLTCPEFQSEDDQATITDTLEEKVKKAAQVTARKSRVKAQSLSLSAIAKRNRKITSATDILGAVHG